MNGRAFFKMLTRRGIPCSALAQQTQTQLAHLYGLKHSPMVASHYLRAVLVHYRHQLTIDDLARLTASLAADLHRAA
ncbi:hypothetical protein FCL40_10460 [Ferrimonas sediminicola]|uniref:Uncharacterized protein n=1 Tax=Ferrimonas sediminicola TaxID=2569538 RepID=A0A4U1BDC0_9GAMM|nr:hypothetical protein [Ferrimonas sediminicola]TKB49053.1 hypothetical protein FCL40_10460 [Ferrimonas sediminicola]